jgi:hypothetical protein
MTYLAALEGSGSRIVATRRTVAPTRSAWKWRRAHLILAVSESARDALIAGGVERGRISVVPEGVDAEGRSPITSWSHRWRRSGPTGTTRR